MTSKTFLYADGARGVYIPQHFAESIRREFVRGVSQKDWDCLEIDPNDCAYKDYDSYWEAWDRVLNNATVEHNGDVYYLWQDGDLWLVHEDELESWNEENQ